MGIIRELVSFAREMFSEASTISSMRVMSFMLVSVGIIIALAAAIAHIVCQIKGITISIDPLVLLSGSHVGLGLGAKTVQKFGEGTRPADPAKPQ
jgi:hypothetical protein